MQSHVDLESREGGNQRLMVYVQDLGCVLVYLQGRCELTVVFSEQSAY